jgi:DNA-binding HxlR family transcriptional regulator
MIMGVAAHSTASASQRAYGLLVRTVYPTVPPKVEYTATDMAHELRVSLAGLTEWAERHRADIAAARTSYDASR